MRFMNRLLSRISFVGILLLPAVHRVAADETGDLIGARYRLWLAAPAGEIRSDGDLLQGNKVDLDDTLGMDEHEMVHDLGAWVNVPFIPILDRINVGYWSGTFDGEKQLDRTFTFEDRVYTAGSRVDSELELQVATLTLESFLPWIGTDDLGATAGLQIGAKYFKARGRIESKTFGFDEEESVEGPVPVVGARVLARLTRWFRVEAEAVGIGGRYGDVGGKYVEGSVELAVTPIHNVFLGVGYKAVLIDLEKTGNEEFAADATLQGIFVSAGVRF